LPEQAFSSKLSPVFFSGVLRVRPFSLAHCLLAFSLCCAAADSSNPPIRLLVDLTDAPRNIFHSTLTIPTAPGKKTFVYPKWIPGHHRPSGPIANLTGLHFRALGRELTWKRDPIEMYSFHVTVPLDAREIEASFDLISTDSSGAGGVAGSSNILDLNWNQVVLYPDEVASDAVQVAPAVRLPEGWRFGTALTPAQVAANEVEFTPVSLTTLVDSPLIAGVHYRQIELVPAGEIPSHVIDLVGDSDADLEMSPPDIAAYRKLVAEADALFGAHHYRQYHFLYTLSDQVGHHGLEHHESSDNSAAERTLTDPNLHLLEGALLPHEFTHSWNGKYRRPAGLATRNYQDPMVGDLLWVYEGLTEYLGNVLTARSGLWTTEQYREALAATAANMDHHAGRTWRPLEDTAVAVQTLRMLGGKWQSWRRGLDYYPEGELIWLDVDATIRQQSGGQRSLDDFCRRFQGGESGPPKIVPYTFDEVVRTLNEVAPYDWATFLNTRVKLTSTHAPLGGVEGGGWRLVYNQKPNAMLAAALAQYKYSNFEDSLGFGFDKEGEIFDVVPGTPAYTAGIGPGMKLIAVNGRRLAPPLVSAALKLARQTHQPIEFIVENGGFFKTYSIPYYEGENNPHLERVEGKPDVLGEILKAKTGAAAK
jgi:predicted metalloprotease with PDZ domain